MQRVVLVTDPMCSWCWGMASEFDRARRDTDAVNFDLMLGGINTHGTQSIGDYGRRFLMRLWREVEETTGQHFGYRLPDEYVHNSTLPCLAVEAMRELSGAVPFDYLHELQRRFFVAGENITERALLAEIATEHGVGRDAFERTLKDPKTLETVRFQFTNASAFGTQALPSLLLEQDGRLQLLAGGYVDAGMLAALLETRLHA